MKRITHDNQGGIYDARMVQNAQINKCDSHHRMKDKNHMDISIDTEKTF